MMSLIQQIRNGQLWDFHGGIHPHENKCQSNQSQILPVDIPPQLTLPVKQHIGHAGKIKVQIGEHVLKGQALTEAEHFQTCPIHAPTSGTVIAIESRPITHPSGLSDLCVVIEPDFEDRWLEKNPIENFQNTTPEQLIEHIRLMGISGMGGAGFPTARKIQSSFKHTEILIINGAECEPYITADDRLMREKADEIVQGIEILQKITSPQITIIAIEDNKPEAIDILKKAIDSIPNTIVQKIPTKYPSGGEKQLIQILTGKEVPSQTIPASIGIMMQNIGTVYAIKRAIIDGEPLIERVITITGQQVKQASNRWALIGTSIDFLLQKHQFEADKKLNRLIIGGPMMGFTLPHANIPVTKTTNCVLVPNHQEIPTTTEEMACIRCSACADVCPASLMPQQLQWYAKAQDYDKCHEYDLNDCIECGACAYVCPSEIPLVQYYRQAKSEIRIRENERLAAERARARFEAKKIRLERDKQAREAKHQQAAEQRRQAMQKSDDGDQIAAAIARVKAKQAEAQNQEAKPAVAAAIARAKAKQAAAKNNSDLTPDNREMIKLREQRKEEARAKRALKAQAEIDANTPLNAEQVSQDQSSQQLEIKTAKQQAVQAAIERAKAKKMQLAAESVTKMEEKKDSKDTDDKQSKVDHQKAAVAAAIARAKAKKAAQANLNQEHSSSKVDCIKPSVQESIPSEAAESNACSPEHNIDPKKAAVAAAIARAKARKAAQMKEAEKNQSDHHSTNEQED